MEQKTFLIVFEELSFGEKIKNSGQKFYAQKFHYLKKNVHQVL